MKTKNLLTFLLFWAVISVFAILTSCSGSRQLSKTKSEASVKKSSSVDSIQVTALDSSKAKKDSLSVTVKTDSSYEDKTTIEEEQTFEAGIIAKVKKKTVIEKKGNINKASDLKALTTEEEKFSFIEALEHSEIKALDSFTKDESKITAIKVKYSSFWFIALFILAGIVAFYFVYPLPFKKVYSFILTLIRKWKN